MAARSAWVLNLDADLELGAGARYQPTRAVRAAMAPHVDALASTLLAPGDVLVDDACAPGSVAGLVGRAFCPTARAIALLVRAGAVPVAHPPHHVLREVNGRAFCAAVGPNLPGAAFVTSLEDAARRIARPPSVALQWRAKPAFGMAGRGQRRIASGALEGGDLAFVRAAVTRDGGLVIEPDVDVVRELAIHGFLDEGGAARLGRVVAQECDDHGQWIATRPATDLDPAVRATLEGEARVVAVALHAARYFGPFGIDAFLFRDRDGAIHLHPRSEINARYSMGFAAGWDGPPPG